MYGKNNADCETIVIQSMFSGDELNKDFLSNQALMSCYQTG